MACPTPPGSLPPLHPSASVGNLAGKRKAGISKKVAQKLAPTTFLVPVESVQLHNSRSCNEISPLSSEAGSSLASHFSEVSIDDLNRSAVSEDLAPTMANGLRKRSISTGGMRTLVPTSVSSDDLPSSETPSTGRLAASLDDGKSDDCATVQSVRSTVLPKITSQEAKKGMTKNYLLMKNGKLSSLLHDQDELERCFPDGKVTVFVGTWNMAGQEVPSKALINWLFPDNMHTTADIYAVGIQEAVFNPNGFKDWESKLQRCLWPCKQVLFHSVSLGVQHLAIFVRRELIWFLSRVGHSSKSTRIVSNVKTKGAIAVGFKLFGTTLLFISSHLSYGPDPNGRIRDYHRIVQSLYWKSFGWRGYQVLENVDVAFWAGDLNFRLDEKRSIVEAMVNAACATSQMDCAVLMERDQLRREMTAGRLFHKFQEKPISFPPTYKYDIGTSAFDTSAKNRVPAYTDRILYRVKSNSSGQTEDLLETVLYDSVPSIKNSDHKPVFGVFRIQVKPGNDHMLTPKFDTAILQAGLARYHDGENDGAVKSKVCRVM